MSQLDEVLAVAANNTAGVFRLSPETLAVFNFAQSWLGNFETWKDFADEQLTAGQIDDIERIIDNAQREIMLPMLGWIMPFATNELPENVLPCTGNTYLRTDYPLLYAVISDALKVGADHFKTPQMQGRYAYGANPSDPVGIEMGSEALVITTANLPAHSHGQRLLNNAIARVFTTSTAGGQAAAAANTPVGNAQLRTDNTGDGEALDNFPAGTAFMWGMIAA